MKKILIKFHEALKKTSKFYVWSFELFIGLYHFLLKTQVHAVDRNKRPAYDEQGNPVMKVWITSKRLKLHVQKRFGTDLFSDPRAWFRRLFTETCFTPEEIERLKLISRINRENAYKKINAEKEVQTANMTTFYLNRKINDPKTPVMVREKLKQIIVQNNKESQQ